MVIWNIEMDFAICMAIAKICKLSSYTLIKLHCPCFIWCCRKEAHFEVHMCLEYQVHVSTQMSNDNLFLKINLKQWGVVTNIVVGHL